MQDNGISKNVIKEIANYILKICFNSLPEYYRFIPKEAVLIFSRI